MSAGGAGLDRFEAVIGMEVHAQLATRTKLFCGCTLVFGAPPNTHVCPVCLGLPGALPVPNRAAFERALMCALALECEIPERTWFDRKNYSYPDQPKNYQITQDEAPVGRSGRVTGLRTGVVVPIDNVHLEEDAGKLLHLEGDPPRSLIDLNRAGTPLAEIVSEPCMRTLEEVEDYMETLRLTLLHAGVSACRMEEGNLRFEASISLRPRGSEPLGARVEIKNLNSTKAVLAALAYEIERQRRLLEQGASVAQETRLWDEERGQTARMRSKEQAHDYRYFPEPDIPPITVDRAWVARLEARIGEPLRRRYERLQASDGLSAYEAGVIVSDPALARYFDALRAASGDAKRAANWLLNDALGWLNESGTTIEAWPVSAEQLAELMRLEGEGRVSRLVARTRVLPEMGRSGESATRVIERLGLVQESRASALEPIVEEVLRAQPEAAAEYRAGKQKVLGFLIGQCMKTSAGKGNPKVFSALLREALERDGDRG